MTDDVDQPARLNREFILDTAIDLIDREGLTKLTMRRLGTACGVEAMALYRYVHSRGDLLTGVVNHIVDRLYADQLAARRQEDGWQDFLLRLGHGVRQIALDHPDVRQKAQHQQLPPVLEEQEVRVGSQLRHANSATYARSAAAAAATCPRYCPTAAALWLWHQRRPL